MVQLDREPAKEKTTWAGLVQNLFVNLFYNNTLEAVRNYTLQGKELQKMKQLPKVVSKHGSKKKSQIC